MTAQQATRRELDHATGPALERTALALLQDLGSRGHSSARSYKATLHSPTAGVEPEPIQAAHWLWLLERNFVRFLEVPVFDARTLSAVHLTATGRHYLRQRNLPCVPGEIEILCDRLGHSLKPHYGQALLFAHLARRLGYVATHGIKVPHRNAVADLLLERGDETLFVSLESGLERRGHPLDRWHVLAQSQAFLPLIAPDAGQLDTAFRRARKQICLIRGASLPDLEFRLHRGARTLWCRRHNRFERDAQNSCHPPQRAHLAAAASCQGLLREAFTCRARVGTNRLKEEMSLHQSRACLEDTVHNSLDP